MSDDRRRFRSESLDTLDGVISDGKKEREKERLEAAKEQSRIDFKKRQDKLLNLIVELEAEFGADYYLVELLTRFFEASVQMEPVMKSMEAVNMAMECITEAINFLDATIDFDRNLMDEITANKYGAIQRFKMKRKMKRARKNNVGRMKAIVDGLLFKYKMMTDMAKSLESFSKDMSSSFAKANKKRGVNASATSSEVQKRIEERRKEKGVSAPTETTSTDEASGNGSGNYDDVL